MGSRWAMAESLVDGLGFDPLASSNLKYIEFSDGINEAEAEVLNKWIIAFRDKYGYQPDHYVLRVMCKRLDDTGPWSYSTSRDTGLFVGRSPNPLKPDQIKTEPEPDSVHVLDGETTLPVERVLDGAKHLDVALVLGYEPDGSYYIASSIADPWGLHTILRRALARVEGEFDDVL